LRRSRRSHARPARCFLRHHDYWPISPAACSPLAGRALRHSGRVCKVARDRNVTRISSRRIEPAHTFLLPRTRTSREMKATIFKQHGGPDVLEYTHVPDPAIRANEVLV